MDLPIELLSKIFGFSDDHSLIILRRTSRLFKTLAEPLLFRKVTLSPESYLHQLPRIVQIKQRTIVEHPRLAVFVVSCSVTALVAPVLPEVSTILNKLINLRRLWMGEIFPDVNLHTCFSSTTRLTHLKCNEIKDIAMLTSFLESQPLLEQLEFEYHGLEQLILPSSALPHLRVFSGSVWSSMSLLPGRNIHHLNWAYFPPDRDIRPDPSFQSLSIQTLSLFIDLGECDTVAAVAHLFPNLKYVQFDIGPGRDNLEDVMDLIYPLATSKIEYIHLLYAAERLGSCQDSASTCNLLTAYFSGCRSLRILDFEFDETEFYPSVVYRHFAGHPVPVQLRLPASDYGNWELWWESRNLEWSPPPSE